MNILHKLDLRKIKESPHVQILFLIWLFFAVLTFFAFYYQISLFRHIDVPTHLGAGLVIAAFIYATVSVRNGKQALCLAFVPFLLWECIEIGISGSTHNPFLFRLFEETRANQLQDVSMDTLGFLVFVKMTGRKFH